MLNAEPFFRCVSCGWRFSRVCCSYGAANWPKTVATVAPLHSGNGGNTIDHGEALAQIDHDARRTAAAWMIALGVLWLSVVGVLIARFV